MLEWPKNSHFLPYSDFFLPFTFFFTYRPFYDITFVVCFLKSFKRMISQEKKRQKGEGRAVLFFLLKSMLLFYKKICLKADLYEHQKKQLNMEQTEEKVYGSIPFSKVKKERTIDDQYKIRYIYGEDYWSDAYLEDELIEKRTATLAYFEVWLDPYIFIRINKNTIIRLWLVATFRRDGKTGLLILFGGIYFCVTERYMPTFLWMYEAMVKKRGF
jgi:hypothetical protein